MTKNKVYKVVAKYEFEMVGQKKNRSFLIWGRCLIVWWSVIAMHTLATMLIFPKTLQGNTRKEYRAWQPCPRQHDN